MLGFFLVELVGVHMGKDTMKYKPENLSRIFRELKKGSARSLILVGGSLVESALEYAIGVRLVAPRTNAEKEALFGEKGIGSTFSEKIWLGYFLKVIGRRTRHDIELIRKIRNSAAHNMNPISFKGHGEIADRCRALSQAPSSGAIVNHTDLRLRFIAKTQFLAMNLFMRAGDENAEIHEAFIGRAPDLSK